MISYPFIFKIFVSICAVLVLILAILALKIIKSDNECKYSIISSIGIGVFCIVSYCIFLFAKTIFWAVFWDGIFFLGTDWLALSMLTFAFKYTGLLSKYYKKIIFVGIILCFLDTIQILVNPYTHHMFNLLFTQGFIGNDGIGYLANDFHLLQYVHLGLCYLLVGLTFLLLMIAILKVPTVYKSKYSGILISYIIVIIANAVCYSLSLPIDFSVVMYGIIAGYVCYYSTYFYPKKLINSALRNVHKIMADAVIYYDVDGNCLFANSSAKKLFDMEEEFFPSVVEDYRRNFLEESETADYLIKHTQFLIDGEKRQYEVEYTKLYSEIRRSRKNNGSIIKFVEKTLEINHYNREKYLATHDELTDLNNRIGFIEEVEKYIRVNGTDNHIMICSNIKDFKLINDLFGVNIGNQILKRQAKLISQFSHKDTIAGRVGDDKFAMFVNKSNFSIGRFTQFIEQVQSITENAYYHLCIHVGIYDPFDKNENAQSMYNKALLAIEEIADDYNKTFSIYDSVLMEKLKEENEIVESFESALKDEQFIIHLQPVYNREKEIIGAEALSRWIHPLKGLLYPEKYISTLEKFGLIYHLDEYIWELSVQILRDWKEAGYFDNFISVNVSKKDFFYSDIFQTFVNLVEKYDVNPRNLHIELSESLLMSDFDKVNDISKKLREYGFKISIDDFGNGYSSLNMLKKFDADTLKIDVHFLQEDEDAQRNIIMLETIIDLAKELHMTILPEAVETSFQFNILNKMKCDEFQGNYFNVPIEIKDFENKFYH